MSGIGMRGITYDEYADIDAVNHGALELLVSESCLARAKHRLDYPEVKDTAAFQLGRAVHCLLLQPDLWRENFVTLTPDFDRRTKRGKEIYGEILANAGGREIITDDMACQARGIAAAVWECKAAKELLTGAETELTLTWTDRESGLPCKGRLDALKGDCIIDVKTTKDARENAFRNTAAAYGYHRQMAFYSAGCKWHGLEVKHHVLIAVEKEPPCCAAVYRLLDEDIQFASQECQELLKRFAVCKTTGIWPGFPSYICDLSAADWQRKKWEATYGNGI